MLLKKKKLELLGYLERIQDLIEKCGGPGSGIPGPCPEGKVKPKAEALKPAAKDGVSKSKAAGDAFDSMPMGRASSKEAKKWRKEMQGRYDSDPEFRAVVDSMTLFTQGDYKVQRIFGERAVTGKWADGYEDSALPGWVDKPMHGNPMADFKTWFERQGSFHSSKNDSPYTRATFSEAAKAVHRAIGSSAPQSGRMYRGVVGWRFQVGFKDLKEGDDFDIKGPSSFTVDEEIGLDFATGQAKGNKEKGARYPTLIEIEPGAKGINVSAISPWDQKEVVTAGRFKVVRVERDDSREFLRIVIRQEDTWQVGT